MRYEKPAVSTIGSASADIQGHEKCLCVVIDQALEYTIGAYETDE